MGGLWRSKYVLLWCQTYMMLGYLEEYESHEYAAQWMLAGRDGYEAPNVTHWHWAPLPPE